MRLESVRELKSSLLEQLAAVEAWSASPSATLSRLSRRHSPLVGIGLALGIAPAPDRPDDYRLAVRISEPLFTQDLQTVSRIAERARGEVDIRRVGMIKVASTNPQGRLRPPTPGCSIGHHAVTAGTLGAFVRQCGDDRSMILSNNHILADEDTGSVGDPILQPGSYDGGVMPSDVIGTLHVAIPLQVSGNRVDAALALMADDDGISGPKTAIRLSHADPIPGMRVTKVGRTTGLTHGIISATELQGVAVTFPRGIRLFDDQIEIDGDASGPFSTGGDSGSVIYNADNEAVGLLFASSESGGSHGNGLTFANDIRHVFSALNLDNSS